MRKLSGFTLVECLVALMILGIAALTLAQVYAAVAKGTKENEFMNISLAQQMQYVEKRDNSQAVKVEQTVTGEKSSHELDDTKYHVNIKGGPVSTLSGNIPSTDYYEYKYGVNMYVLYSRDVLDQSSTEYEADGVTEKENEDFVFNEYEENASKLRYKYLQPREPDQTIT